MSEPSGLVLLSEGHCPLGHGALKKRRCETCDVRWRLRLDELGQWVTAERRNADDIHGIARVIKADSPAELVTAELEDALRLLDKAAAPLVPSPERQQG